jgi:hypothetical protein
MKTSALYCRPCDATSGDAGRDADLRRLSACVRNSAEPRMSFVAKRCASADVSTAQLVLVQTSPPQPL